MSTKALHSLTDKGTDMQNQLGCMSGIFQLFGRQYFLTGRRVNGHNHKRLPSGQDVNHGTEKSGTMQKMPVGKEKLMAPVEPSRTSFSSSCSSSTFSSADWNKKAQSEPSSSCQSSFNKITTPPLLTRQPSSSPHLLPQSLDIRDIVKDSMYRETHQLSVKTTKEKVGVQVMKHIDSPRPFQQHKSGNQNITRNDGSLRTVGKSRGTPRTAKEQKYSSPTLTPRDAPRYSYDERISQDKLKSTAKFKELPRLSLDSRERSIRSSASQSRSNYLPREIDAGNGISRQTICPNQEPGSNKRPSAIVARLMGLEPTPDFSPTDESQILLKEDSDAISRTSRIYDKSKQNQVTGTPIVSRISGLKYDNSLKKSTSCSKSPLEPAPWKQADSKCFSQKQTSKIQEALKKSPQTSPSVYGEIQKRLAELEFKKSGKDLRALKQILEAMENKREKLENTKEEQVPYFESHRSECSPSSTFDRSSTQHSQSNNPTSPIVKGSSSPKRHGSQIVIMKPNKQTEKPATKFDCKPVIHKKWPGDNAHNILELVDKRKATDITLKRNHPRDAPSWPQPPNEIKTKVGILRSSQLPTALQHIGGDNHASNARSSRNLGQRLQKKETDKLTYLTTQSPDPRASRKQTILHPVESGSPTRKFRAKLTYLQQDIDELNWSSNEARNLSHQGDTVSMQSESGISLDSQMGTETTGQNHIKQITSPFRPKDPSKEDFTTRLSEDVLIAELATITLEQPSPVSVLDISFYEEDFPSPVKKRLSAFQDYNTQNSNEAERGAVYIDHMKNKRSSCSYRFDQRKLENIDHLVHKLRLVNTQDEATKNCVESVCDDNNSEHRYIAEMLVAAGILMDRGSNLTAIQLHPSELPLNPKLFHVLERVTWNTKLVKENHEKDAQSKFSKAIQRKLLFDVVNEILAHKSALAGSLKPWIYQNKLAENSMRGDNLFKELCSKITDKQPATYSSAVGDYDSMTTVLSADMKNESHWAAYSCELPGIVLDIERMIFKDLIGEVVSGGTTGLRLQPGTHCRKLFPK
ncbi:Protein LONGIFOLIA like [Heracleum sosnowskyi]|uniref:Protein LONGIFOLIA like n=1 Tax=Heracleum sosnowskyi TaxID=360622 RepID=A0AAD8HD51_9APIA|nr:Protein LONGIFOLIA like [Heracleum sosnowskyi]